MSAFPRTITVKFVDFWPSFDENDNKFLAALRSGMDAQVIPSSSPEIPDLLFYSQFGMRHLDYESSVKIYYTGENDVPDFNECDYAISFHHIDFGRRHLRYPIYMLYEHEELGSGHYAPAARQAVERPFCSFLMRNHYNCDPRRLEIVDAVESYRPIAYGGPWRNNIGGPVEEKIPFIAGYKFNLALENSLLPGYVTEKLLEPLVADTVPIYWGPDDAADEFNPEAFMRVRDYNDTASFVEALRALDTDDAAYMAMLRAPKLNADRNLDFDARLAEFLGSIAKTMRKQTVSYGLAGSFHRKNLRIRPFLESRNFIRLTKFLARFSSKNK